MPKETNKRGCGCANIPFSLILLLLGGGYWWLIHLGNANAMLSRFKADDLMASGKTLVGTILTGSSAEDDATLAEPIAGEPRFTPPPVPNLHSPVQKGDNQTLGAQTAPQMPSLPPSATLPASASSSSPTPTLVPPTATETTAAQTAADQTAAAQTSGSQTSGSQATAAQTTAAQATATPATSASTQKPWKQTNLRGIYLSRYHITNNASEATIRKRVRYYKSQGINTIIHGVWGNGCTMYNSEVMQKTLGYSSCPNQFQGQWLDWMIDEAHKQGMEVHAYFEKGIKLDENSPIFDLATRKRWIVPGVDRTYERVDHYVLDVEVPEVATFFKDIVTEFVQRYPEIDAVQWDDYLGYHAELPGQVDRTEKLTQFLRSMIAEMKQANPNVSFDVCHHNPYWAKRYFAADWENWGVDRAFIQVYNDANFEDELGYVRQYNGIALADNQMHRLKQVANDPTIESILLFPVTLKPENAAAQAQKTLAKAN